MGGFISGISVFCFAASYGVSLALEVSRLLFRSGVRGAIMVGFAVAGLFAHTLFLGQRAYSAYSDQLPALASSYDWFLMAAWFLSAGYLYLTLHHPKTAIGVFVLPVVLLLIVAAVFFADDTGFSQAQQRVALARVHGVFLLGGTIAALGGLLGGLMYLLQSVRLKKKRLAIPGLKLPSLERLERWNHWAVIVTVFAFGIGIGLGVAQNVLLKRLVWTDPVVLTGIGILTWLATVAVFNLAYKPARQGRKLAYLAVATGTSVAVYLIVFLGPTGHNI